MSSSESELRMATVKVWSGGPLADYDDILNEKADEYEMEIVDVDTHHVPHSEHVVLAENIENHGRYAFDLDAEETVELHVETSDHYHDTVDGFERGYSIERGLRFKPDVDATPFKTEIWGAIRMRVEEELEVEKL
jgi:hypothetical protein